MPRYSFYKSRMLLATDDELGMAESYDFYKEKDMIHLVSENTNPVGDSTPLDLTKKDADE